MNSQHSILVVDDEPQIVRSLINLLRTDYRVLGATRSSEALQVLQREEIHLVMCDQRMPEMTGVELLHRVSVDYPKTIRMLFTGYADLNAVIDAINRGRVYRYITKPWNPQELQLIIRDACAHYDLLAERNRLLDELQRKNENLKQANDLKTAFIRVAGHEFRTPVTILVGLCKLALRDPELGESARDSFTRLDGASARLQRLVNQILAMLAAERFDRVLDLQPAEISAVLTQAAEDIRPFVRLRHQTLEIDLAADLGFIEADVVKIRDCLDQLLLNAVKFTPDHGKIALEARRLDDGITIRVIDNGDGIAPESVERMFEPFFTGFDVSRHSSGEYEYRTRGLGLGLSLVKAFVAMHGGTVGVESSVGKGSTFTIYLPRRVNATETISAA